MKKYDIDSCLQEVYSKPLEDTNSPIIGITGNAQGEDYFLRQCYVDQVEKAGGIPLVLTPCQDPHVLAQQLDMLDGLLFTGGADHNPLWQGEDPQPGMGNINPKRDAHELMLCRLAYDRNIPMLGICRGIQTMAVALGGHVCQDIKTLQAAGKIKPLIKHSQDAPKTEFTHAVTIECPVSIDGGKKQKGSMLYNIYKDSLTRDSRGNGVMYVNSFHHQIVDKTGKRFRAVAKSADGLIEAMESTEFRPLLGVQWHPEQLGEEGLKLFVWLNNEAEIFRQAKALHKRIVTIDSHCDTPMFFPKNINFLSRDPRILYDLHKMDEGHIDAVNMVCYLPQPKFGEGWRSPMDTPVADKNAAAQKTGQKVISLSPREYADLIFDMIEEICNKKPNKLSIAKSPRELIRDKREGRHSIMLGIENGLALEHELKYLEHFKNKGITYITLCHNGDNDLCDSARGCQTNGGLAPFGRNVIKEMNRLGIMVDLSHAHETSFYGALACSTKPVVCSHSNCRALCDHPRNLTDDQMRQLAATGGVMQLTLYPGFLRETEGANIEDFLKHLEHAIEVMGIDHVGVGTDFDGDGGVCGLANAAELINLTEHLIRRGYSERDIEKIWGKNWLRVMAENQA